jgi:hypothetical protein
MGSETPRQPLDVRLYRPLTGEACTVVPASVASADTACPWRATPCNETSDPIPAAFGASASKTDSRDQPPCTTNSTPKRPLAASIESICDKFVIVQIEREPERHPETAGSRAVSRSHDGPSNTLESPKIQPLDVVPILRSVKQRTLSSTGEQKT